jgi:hypothetical protein
MRTSILLFAGAAVLYAVVAPTAAVDDEWQPIPDVGAPYVQDLGKCAVDEHNKVANCDLKFVYVMSGKVRKTTGGYTYLLDVDALRLDRSHEICKVEVVDERWTGRSVCKLVSFGCKPVSFAGDRRG